MKPSLWRNERGTVLVLVAVGMVALLGFGALIIDVGNAYVERRTLQTAADAGALAGAQILNPSGNNEEAVKAEARRVAKENLKNTVWDGIKEPQINGNKVTVTIDHGKETFFARVLSGNGALDKVNVTAAATAEKKVSNAYGTLIPIAFKDPRYDRNGNFQGDLSDEDLWASLGGNNGKFLLGSLDTNLESGHFGALKLKKPDQSNPCLDRIKGNKGDHYINFACGGTLEDPSTVDYVMGNEKKNMTNAFHEIRKPAADGIPCDREFLGDRAGVKIDVDMELLGNCSLVVTAPLVAAWGKNGNKKKGQVTDWLALAIIGICNKKNKHAEFLDDPWDDDKCSSHHSEPWIYAKILGRATLEEAVGSGSVSVILIK